MPLNKEEVIECLQSAMDKYPNRDLLINQLKENINILSDDYDTWFPIIKNLDEIKKIYLLSI